MKNVLSTIPRGRFKDWAHAERVCFMCDGEEKQDRAAWFWLVNCAQRPKDTGIGAVCFMVFDGEVRGYFDIVDVADTERYRDRHGIGKPRNTVSLVLANWHPIRYGVEQRGFQGWRYTALRP